MKKFFESLIEAMLKSVADTLTVDASNLQIDNSQNVMDIVNIIWQYFVLFAIGLTLVYFLIEINEKWALEGRDLTLKSMFAPFFKLVIAIIILLYASRIMSAMLTWNNGIMTSLQDKMDAKAIEDFYGDGSGDDIKDGILGGIGGLLQYVIMFIPFLLILIVSFLIRLVLVYKCILYKVELLWRVSITPVAVTDVYQGQRSNAIRWFKGIIAHIIYGASFMVVPYLIVKINPITITASNGVFDAIKGMLTFLVVPFAYLGLLTVIKQATKEALS